MSSLGRKRADMPLRISNFDRRIPALHRCGSGDATKIMKKYLDFRIKRQVSLVPISADLRDREHRSGRILKCDSVAGQGIARGVRLEPFTWWSMCAKTCTRRNFALRPRQDVACAFRPGIPLSFPRTGSTPSRPLRTSGLAPLRSALPHILKL